MNTPRVTFGLVATLLAAHAAVAAGSPEQANFPVERFRPAIDGSGIIDVDSGDVGDSFDVNAGAFINYALNPLVLRSDNARVGALVAHRVGLDVTAAISLFDWVQLGFDMPVVLFQARDLKEAQDVVTGATDLQAIGTGDLRVLAKIRVLRERDQFVDLALIPALTMPTGLGGDTGSYVGEAQFTFAPELAVSKTVGAVHLAADVGYRLRPEERKVVNVTIGHELTYRVGAGFRFPDQPLQIDFSANGGTYAFEPFSSGLEENPLEVLGAVSYDVMPNLRVTGGVGKGILSGFGTPDFRAFLGVRLIPLEGPKDTDGDGIFDDADQCKDDPEDKDGFQDSDGCPDPDNDNDAVFDKDDGAPLDPEDRDGFEDDDGVPDPDNDKDGLDDGKDRCPNKAGPVDNEGCPFDDRDKDGIVDNVDACPDEKGPARFAGCPDKDGDLVIDKDDACPDVKGLEIWRGCPDTDGDGFIDSKDKCPTEPETVNGVDDDDGCPDKGKTSVKLTREKIEILDKVYFDVNKDTIQERSFKLLDQVSSILKAHPELKAVRVEGHTDSDGSDDANLDLSARRAKAVARYLVDKGVAPTRLDPVGYGETKPVVPNSTRANKEQNRRVEFVIVGNDDGVIESNEGTNP